MAVENGPADGLTESDDVRRRALLRLGVAGVVTATALAGLWWLDQGGGKPEKATPTALPSPIVSAPPQASAPPQTPAEVTATEIETPDEVVDDTPAQAVAGAQAARDVPPPRAAAATSPLTRPLAASDAPPPPRVSNAPRAYSPPTPPPHAQPPARPPAQPAAGLGEPYLVRAGIFSDPARARELVERLNQQGIRAHLETRVHLGPFANRGEAEKAQATLRKLGITGVLTPAAATQ